MCEGVGGRGCGQADWGPGAYPRWTGEGVEAWGWGTCVVLLLSLSPSFFFFFFFTGKMFLLKYWDYSLYSSSLTERQFCLPSNI